MDPLLTDLARFAATGSFGDFFPETDRNVPDDGYGA